MVNTASLRQCRITLLVNRIEGLDQGQSGSPFDSGSPFESD
jgi:hypothetical protein